MIGSHPTIFGLAPPLLSGKSSIHHYNTIRYRFIGLFPIFVFTSFMEKYPITLLSVSNVPWPINKKSPQLVSSVVTPQSASKFRGLGFFESVTRVGLILLIFFELPPLYTFGVTLIKEMICFRRRT